MAWESRQACILPSLLRKTVYVHCLKLSVTVGSFVMYRVAGEAKAQIGRVVDVASTRDNVPQCDNFIEGEQETHEGSSNISSEEDTRMPVQFVQLNIFRHLSSFEEQAFLELEDAAKDNNTSDEWQVVVQVNEDCWIPSTSICDLSFVL